MGASAGRERKGEKALEGLEVLYRRPERGECRPTPLLFVHGAYAGAWSWETHYLPFFARRGWCANALSLSGHAGSAGREYLDMLSLDHFVNDVRRVIRSLDRPPVLIGHSMGGLIVQKCLETEDVPGVVLLASVPPQGLMSAATAMMLTRPSLTWDLNRVLGGGIPQLETLREALFYQPVSHATLMECFVRMQPESMRAIWDMTLFNLPNPARMHRPPMLVLGAAHDTLIPVAQVELTARTYGVDAEIFPEFGHGLMLEEYWQAPAERIAEWLDEQGF